MNTTEQSSAIADAESAARNRPDDSSAFEQLGSAYFEAGRLEEAMTAFQRAIELNPGAARVYEKIGHVHYHAGTYPQAITAYEQAIASDPHCIPSYYWLGMIYGLKLGRLDREIESLERGLAANPGEPFLAVNLGATTARVGEIGRAIEILEQVVKDHPGYRDAHDWLSYLYFRQNRLEDAAASCRREIELGEDAHSPHRVLGLIYLLLGREKDAVAELERAVELEPRDYEARAALAKLYRERGDLPAAEHQFNTGLEMAGEDEEAGVACFHAVYGNIDQAFALLETACAKGQLSPGWIHIDPELYFLQEDPRFRALAC